MRIFDHANICQQLALVHVDVKVGACSINAHVKRSAAFMAGVMLHGGCRLKL